MIENSQQLGELLRAEAARLGLRLSFDTHYNAENWVLTWWRGPRKHRLDFQPMPANEVHITHYQDSIRGWPRALVRMLDVVGFFRDMSSTEWTNIEHAHFPIEREHVQSIVASCVGATSLTRE